MKDPIIISVGGGKGGVGKSTITANLGATLSQKGYSVGFIDADLGGANLHLCLGVKRPAAGLQDYISGKYKSLSEIAVPTVIPNSWLVSGASDILELANPNFAQKQKIINNLRKMNADYIIVDLGAGSNYHVTDFFAAFPHDIVVVDGLPTSIENAYGFLKNGVVRGLVRLFPGNTPIQKRIRSFSDPISMKAFATVNELLSSLAKTYPQEVAHMKQWLHQRRTLLILNMVRTADDIKVGTRFSEMVKKYLSVTLHYIGYITYSPDFRTSIRQMRPLMLENNQEKTRECFEAITQNIIAITREQT
ncbi:MAG: MinD/ParA family protein [Fibrobacter sp.]|mgnify:CR=1 FL=1|nr:MinD/ParA family protein [Fibrobacter sp.]